MQMIYILNANIITNIIRLCQQMSCFLQCLKAPQLAEQWLRCLLLSRKILMTINDCLPWCYNYLYICKEDHFLALFVVQISLTNLPDINIQKLAFNTILTDSPVLWQSV